MMVNCPNCGKEHQELREHWPEINRYNRALDRIQQMDLREDGLFSQGFIQMILAVYDSYQPSLMHSLYHQNNNDRDGVFRSFVCDMMQIGYVLGALTHDIYEEKLGGAIPEATEEEIEADYQEYERIQSEGSTAPRMKEVEEAIQKFAKEQLGIEVDLEMLRVPNIGRRRGHDDDEGDSPPPGFFL